VKDPVGTKDVPNTSKRRRGRPSKKDTLEHVELIRPFWRKGFTVAKTTEMLERKGTKLSERTIQTYYHEWNNLLEEAKSHDLIEQEKEIKNRAVAALEDVIEFLDIAKEDLDTLVNISKKEYLANVELKEQDKKGEVPEPKAFRGYIRDRADIAKTLLDCHIRKFQVEIEPTIDQITEEKIAKLVRESREKHTRQ